MTDRRALTTLPDGSLWSESTFQAWLASWRGAPRVVVRRLSTLATPEGSNLAADKA